MGNTHLIDDELDIETSKPSSSRFFFLLGFFGIFVFAWAGCYSLWTHSFKPADDVPVNKSSLLAPEYESK
ncbi:MAG: hypothetical protein QM642_01765 [Edaphocola sp.]